MHCSFAPSHTSLVVQQFLAEKIILVITQPPYSPDLAPSDFWLLYTPKMGLRGTRFATIEDIECDDRTPEDSKRSLPPVLPTKAGLMEQVCMCARVLLWRWSGKRFHMSYHYSATPHFRELFDCASYTSISFQIWKSEHQILTYVLRVKLLLT